MACCKPKSITVFVDSAMKACGNGTIDAPFQSLALAFAYAKELLRDKKEVHVNLSLADGIHFLGDTLSYRGRNLGNPKSSLTLSGDAGKSIITGAVPFDAKLFEKVDENIYAAHLAGMGKFRYLYVDGKIANIANMGGRHTDDEDARCMRYDRTFDAKDPTHDAREDCKMYLAMDMVAPMLGDATSGRVAVRCAYHCEYEWNFNIIHMVAVDLDDTVMYEEEGVCEKHVACYFKPSEYKRFLCPARMEAGLGESGGYHLKTRMYFLSENAAFLRKENDYYYDSASETLYYYTKTDIKKHKFACAKLDYLFRCEELRNVTFRGITFTGTDNLALHLDCHTGEQACSYPFVEDGEFPKEAAVYSKSAYHVTFDGCFFTELGCEGISFGGRVENLTVKNCRFENLGACAIRVAEAHIRKFDKEDGLQNALIENNYIVRSGRELYGAPAIMFAACKDVTITHNTIHDIPYTGISVGWCWAPNPKPYGEMLNLSGMEISYNYIYDYMKDLADGGAIYTLGGNAHKEEHTLFNHSHDNCVVMTKLTGNGRGNCLMGIYYDGSSTNWHSKNNLVVAQSYGAAPTEENPGYSERFMRIFRERRRRSIYFFSQYIKGAEAHNVLHENCYLIRCRESEPEKQQFEAHYNTMSEERWVTNPGMHFIPTFEGMPEEAASIITGAGAPGYGCDLSELKKDRY